MSAITTGPARPTPASPPPTDSHPGDWPDESKIVTEDGKPVDNVYSEKQMRLLTEPLYSNWAVPEGDRRFVVMADVGLFSTPHDPLVPDVMLSVNVTIPEDDAGKPVRSYFLWRYGKPPDVVIEVVSNREGGEDTTKPPAYASLGVGYYVIHDPLDLLGGGKLRLFQLAGRKYRPISGPLLEGVGLGLTLWPGRFEGKTDEWLRWCDDRGNLIPTGAERAEAERTRADKLLALLREKGIDPGEL
jgi:Uma2 family endonuclease